MAGTLAKIGGGVKSLAAEIKSLPFSAFGGNYGSYNSYGGGYGGGMNSGAFGFGLPGSQYEDKAAAGVLWENPSAAACFVALTKAFAQARPYLEKKVKPDADEWEREDHLITQLLERPNEFYSGEKMFGVSLIAAMSQGAAFWRFERDRKGDVSEIWYEPPVGIGASGLAPRWDAQNFIKDYIYVVDGKPNLDNPLAREDVVYFRHGLNVANPRNAWAPLGLGAREIAVLNGASTYTSAVLRNHGAPAGFVSMDGGGLASATAPTPDQATALKEQIENKFGGPQNAGKTFVSPLPWKWNKVGMTPAEMVIDTIRQWPQETVCALLGTPVTVALLPTGGAPTYQNLDASMRWWWDNTIIPLEDSFADEIETQMFPAFGLDPSEYRIAWDRTKVPALQEDEQAKLSMWASTYQAGGIDRFTYKTKINIETEDADKGLYHPSATPNNPDAAPLEPEEVEKQKRLQAATKAEWDESKVTRGGDGEFAGHAGSSGGAFEALREWAGNAIPPESKAFQDGKARAVQKLLPYAKPGSNEAASVVLKLDGSEYDFAVGTPESVSPGIPNNDENTPVAVLHTHPEDLTFSPADYHQLLSSRNIEQSHVIAPSGIYSLHKPPEWMAMEPVTRPAAERAFQEATIKVFSRAEDEGVEQSETEEREGVMRELSKKYGILWRKGTAAGD